MEERTHEQLLQELNKLKRAQARVKRRTTFLLCVIALLVLITSTLAWFTLSNFAAVNDIEIRISTAPQLYLDIEDRGTDLSQWKKTLTNEMINSYLTSISAPRIEDQLLDPVTTSNGIVLTNRSGVTREANRDTYLEFKVWFIATTDMWVHLSGDKVEVDGEEVTSAVTTTETDSKADIVNCLRLSYEDDGAAAIWEPNRGTPVANQTTFDVDNGYSDATRIFHLEKMTPKQITFRVWLEGEDPEGDDDVQDATAKITMLFAGTDETNTPFV